MTRPVSPRPVPSTSRSVAADLAVVVPAVNGAQYLAECLDALARVAASGVGLQVIVVDRCGATLGGEAKSGVLTIPVDITTTIPQMRAIAFAAATAPAVAVIEDHVLVPEDWGRRMLQALADGDQVVGGAVANAATERLVDRAAFLCEYSHLLAPARSGDAAGLTGNNVAYTRDLLQQYTATLAEGRWEDHLHAAMRRRGVRLSCRPDITVFHKMHHGIAEYVSQRFLYSRAYAGLKALEMSVHHRVLSTLATVVLPPLLLARIAARAVAARRHGQELAATFPLLVLFVCAWALGEAVGYATGPGNAMVRVR